MTPKTTIDRDGFAKYDRPRRISAIGCGHYADGSPLARGEWWTDREPELDFDPEGGRARIWVDRLVSAIGYKKAYAPMVVHTNSIIFPENA
jgi:hypothetical protein